MTMTNSNVDQICQDFSSRLGIEFKATSGKKDGYDFIDLRPVEPEYPDGFTARIHLFWQRLEISFIPDSFAAILLEDMGHAKPEQKNAFTTIASSMLEESTIDMKINGVNVDPLNPESWEIDWKKFEIKLEKYFTKNIANLSEAKPLIMNWGERFLSIIIALLPLEEAEIHSPDISGLPEGAITRVIVNRYERNQINRAACIAKHGCYCHVCGFTFSKNYGVIGDGFIHVHHITPVSEIGEAYIINPATDLIPVCPNCHAMLHRNNPPLTIAALKNIFRSNVD